MKCDFDIGYLGRIRSKECNVKNLVITSPNQTVTSINGNSGNYYHSMNIRILKISSQTVHYLPAGNANLLPNLEAIQIYKSSLKSIARRDLEPFKSLTDLIVHLNDVETLDDDLFESNHELRNIYFIKNKLTYIGGNIFKPLVKLDRAFFKDNICINQSAFGPIQLKELKTKIRRTCLKV